MFPRKQRLGRMQPRPCNNVLSLLPLSSVSHKPGNDMSLMRWMRAARRAVGREQRRCVELTCPGALCQKTGGGSGADGAPTSRPAGSRHHGARRGNANEESPGALMGAAGGAEGRTSASLPCFSRGISCVAERAEFRKNRRWRTWTWTGATGALNLPGAAAERMGIAVSWGACTGIRICESPSMQNANQCTHPVIPYVYTVPYNVL